MRQWSEDPEKLAQPNKVGRPLIEPRDRAQEDGTQTPTRAQQHHLAGIVTPKGFGRFKWTHGVSVGSSRHGNGHRALHCRPEERADSLFYPHSTLSLGRWQSCLARHHAQILTTSHEGTSQGEVLTVPPTGSLIGCFSHPAQCYDRPRFGPFISPRARAISRTGLAVWAVCKEDDPKTNE
jgi:hypothetical protein